MAGKPSGLNVDVGEKLKKLFSSANLKLNFKKKNKSNSDKLSPSSGLLAKFSN